MPVISVDNSAVSSIAVGNNGGGSNVSDDGSSSAAPRRMGAETVVGMGVMVIGMIMGGLLV